MEVITGLVGLIIGGLVSWFVCESVKLRRISDVVNSSKVEIARYEERFSSSEREKLDLSDAIQKRESENKELNKQNIELSVKNQETQTSLEKDIKSYGERISSFEREKLKYELENKELNGQVKDLSVKNQELLTTIGKDRESWEGKLAILNNAETRLREIFKGLSLDALTENSASFLRIAGDKFEDFGKTANADFEARKDKIQEFIKPIENVLGELKGHIRDLEQKREQAYGKIDQHLASVKETQEYVRKETHNLVQALRSPHVRGHWGEIQLENILKIAGMVEHCDFETQERIKSNESLLRTDIIINLPMGGSLVIDAKFSMDAYLNFHASEKGEEKQKYLKEHAQQVKQRVKELSGKAYWQQLARTPNFVVMFIPSEGCYSAALQEYPDLIEGAAEERVIISPPTTLIALLSVIALGWREVKFAENAEEIRNLGNKLYDRICIFGELFKKLGESIYRSLNLYNDTLTSFQSRFVVAARDFKALGVGTGKEIPQISGIEGEMKILDSSTMSAIENEGIIIDDYSEGEG